MADERKYINPDLLSGDLKSPNLGEKEIAVAVKEQPDAMFMKNRVPVPAENPVKIPVAASLGSFLNAPANTIAVKAQEKPTNKEEARMSPDKVGGRKYITPDFEQPTETKTIPNEPKDLNQVAALARLPGGGQSGQNGKQYDDDVEAAFNWEPTKSADTSSVGSNLYDASTREYDLALKDYMASMGYKDPSELLKPKYNSAFSKVMEGHGYPQYPVNPTLENMQKYNQDVADYNARLGSAKAAGLAAIQTEKEGLSDKAAKWAENIAKENQKIIGVNGEMLYDPTKRAAANAILNNEIQIKAVQSGLAKSNTLPEILAQLPSLAYAAGVARNPELQPTEFAIKETKGIVDAVMPLESANLKEEAMKALTPWLIGKILRKDVGPNPLEIMLQKAEYANPAHIKARMQEYLGEVRKMNNTSKSNYIKHSTPDKLDPLPPPGKETEFDKKDLANNDKAKLILDSMLRWNNALKTKELTPEEAKLGIVDPNKTPTGTNEGVAAFQSFLKKELKANNMEVTGVVNPGQDQAALNIYLNKHPELSAKDVMSQALAHKAVEFGDDKTGGKTGGAKKTSARTSSKGR